MRFRGTHTREALSGPQNFQRALSHFRVVPARGWETLWRAWLSRHSPPPRPFSCRPPLAPSPTNNSSPISLPNLSRLRSHSLSLSLSLSLSMPTLRSATASASTAGTASPTAIATPRSAKRRLTSPRRAAGSPDASQFTSPHKSPNVGIVGTPKLLSASPRSSRKRLYGDFVAAEKPKWNPRGKSPESHFSRAQSSDWDLTKEFICSADPAQMQVVKEALHVATVPSCGLVCRDDEQSRVLEFCKGCVEQERAGSLYVCGCPGTGKTLSINKVKESVARWADETGMETPDALSINCTSLAKTHEIFSKILAKFQTRKKATCKLSPLQQLQTMFSHKESAPRRMLLVVVDEMDYLITRDRAVLHDLFMLTTYQFSRCILIGIANAIDLADRFLPKLESLNCKPLVVTFRAYSKDQISDIIKHRLKVLEYDVFEPLALEFCARKVAAASGDMRKALGVCRSAVEVFEARLQESSDQEFGLVTFDHMDIALSKAFKSPVVDSILCLPQHQQMVLCALANTFHHCKKKATTLGELNKSYIEICRSTQVPAVGMLEFSNMCMVLSDQGFMKLGQSKEDKLRRVMLQIDSSDITFAFKGNRFFQKCLEQQKF
ncbi:cell division control protein 6 homolog isoform X1 [Oryza glaberrima]|uniref:cell division control protein 6 homolog isoform X1 n=1 Tax=Oryza glaberrima TaxID=4538 RepID=UPI00224BFA8F|nr:cell division control protein 6 homolog isoform X1 [Oryza glaberrima]